MKQKYDIFVSYRRSSYDTANLIATRLRAAGYSVFFDMETLRSGKFNEQLFDVIDNCTDFLLVLPPQALDRCVNEDDWVRLEVCRAMARNKNIIPVMLNGFVWPTPMPLGMEELCNYQALTASSIEYFDLALQRLQERYLLSRRHRSAKRTVMWTGVGLCALAVVVAIGLFVFRIMAKGVCEDYAARMTNHVSRIHVLAEENVGLESDWDKFLKTWERKTDSENRSLLKDDFLARLDVAAQNVKMLIPEDTVTWQISGYDRFLLSLYGINGAELAMYPQMTKLYLTDYMTQLDIYRQFFEDGELVSIETEWGTTLFDVQEHSNNIYYASYLSFVACLPNNARKVYEQQVGLWKHFPDYTSNEEEKYYESIINKEGQLIDDLMARYDNSLQYTDARLDEMDAQLDELEAEAVKYETEFYNQMKAKSAIKDTDEQWQQWGKITVLATFMNDVALADNEDEIYLFITPDRLYSDLLSMLSTYQAFHPEAQAYVSSAKAFYKEVSRAKLPFAGVLVFAFKDDVPHDIFKVGDIITAMNGIPVKNYDELKAAFKTEGGDGSVRFLRFDGKELVEHRSPSYGDTSIVGFLNLTD